MHEPSQADAVRGTAKQAGQSPVSGVTTALVRAQSYLSEPTVCLAFVPSTRTGRYCAERCQTSKSSQGVAHNTKCNIVPEVRVSSLSKERQYQSNIAPVAAAGAAAGAALVAAPTVGQPAETLWAAGEWQRHLPLKANSTASATVPSAASHAAVPCNAASSSPATLWYCCCCTTRLVTALLPAATQQQQRPQLYTTLQPSLSAVPCRRCFSTAAVLPGCLL